MPRIEIPQLQRVLDVESGANLMRSLLKAGVPVASSCNGECVCAKCKLVVGTHRASLPPPDKKEKFLVERLKIPSSFRLSCQVYVFEDITVSSTYW